MASFNTISIRFNADLKQFSSQMQNAQRSMQKYGKQMQNVGATLTAGLTLPILGIGAAATKTFADFEQSMAKVKAISGATGEQFQALRKNAEDLGATTRYTASQVAELQLNFSKLGLKPDEILNATEATLNLALATGEDLANSATVAASTVRGFNLSVEETTRVTDVMAKSFSSSALDLEKFQTAMAVVAPVANVAGQSLEQTTGMLSVLVNAGIDASTAGTGLRNIFLDIAQSGMSLEEALESVNNSTNKNKTSMDLFGKRGATVATVLAENWKQAKIFATEYDNAAGAAKAMADIMDNTLQGSFYKVKSAVESAFIAIGEQMAPAIRKVADFVSDLVSKFKDLSPTTKKVVVVVGILAAAIGPLLLIMGTLMTTVIPGIIAILPTLGAAFTALTGPIGLVVAAIAAIAYVVYDNWDRIKKEMVNLQNYFIDLYNESMLFRAAIESIILYFKTLWNVVKLVFESIFNIIKNVGKYILDTFKNVGAGIKAVLTGDFSALTGIFQKQTALMGQAFSDTVGDIGGKFKTFTDNVKQDFSDAIDNVTKRKKIAFVKENIDTKAIEEKVSEAVQKGLSGGGRAKQNTTDLSPFGAQQGAVLGSPLAGIVAANEQLIPKAADQNEQFLSNAIAFNEGLSEIVQNTATNFVSGFGQIIGAMAAGTASAGDIGKLLLGTFADMAIQLGEMAIGIGLAVEGIKTALQSLNPVVAIAAGVALVALGSFAKSALGNISNGGGSEIPKFANGGLVYGPTVGLMGEYSGARNNPEVIAPLDKLKGMLSDAVGDGGGRVEFEIQGQKLIGVLNRAQTYRNRRL